MITLELYPGKRPEDRFVQQIAEHAFGSIKAVILEAVLAAYGQDPGRYKERPEVVQLRARMLGLSVYPGCPVSAAAPDRARGAAEEEEKESRTGTGGQKLPPVALDVLRALRPGQ